MFAFTRTLCEFISFIHINLLNAVNENQFIYIFFRTFNIFFDVALRVIRIHLIYFYFLLS